MEPNWDFVFHRRHPHYFRNLEWQRSAAAYAGGEACLRQALIRHVSEVELEFAERLRRAYYFNDPRKPARLITQFVFSVEPTREGADPELVEDFPRSGLRTGEVMRQFSTLLNVFGGAAAEKFSHVLARSAAIRETPEERDISRYISSSGADTGRIREENDALKRELSDTVGMALVTPCREAQTAESRA